MLIGARVRRWCGVVSALVLLILAFHCTGVAQTTTATILGTVTDATGAVVAGATVQVKNSNTAVTQTTMTDAQGRFIVPDLQVGTYQVQTSATGFQTLIKNGITLTVGGQSVIDFTLQVGQVQQTVTVESEAVQVQTTTSEVSSLVTPLQMSELPLNGRNFEQLIELSSGVQTLSTNNHQSFSGSSNLYSVAGSRPEGAVEMLDDTELNTFWGLGSGSMALGTDMGVEAIGQFQTLTNTYSSQFGGNGAVMNATTKSGTNALHGSLLEFLRNSGLDARNFNDGPSVPEFRQNQFGGSLGGPIVKNKLFFFVDYEGLRRAQGTSATAFVPDAAARQGYVPNTAGTAYVPFTGAKIGGTCTAVYSTSSNCITNSLVQQILAIYPTSTSSGLASSGVVSVPEVANTYGREDYGVIRMDYTLTDKDSLFGRYIIDWAFRYSPFNSSANAIPYWPEQDFTHTQYYVMEERHLFSPNMINLARFAFSRPNQFAVSADTNSTVVPGVPVSTAVLDFFPNREEASLSAASGTSSMGDDNSHLPYNLGVNRFSYGDDVLWTHGAHSLRFGMQVDRVQNNDSAPFNMGGTYSFNNLNSFLAGSPSSAAATILGQGPNAYRYVRYVELFPYVQDEWRVSRKLTANIGLRYEYMDNPSCRPCVLAGPEGNIAQANPIPPNFGYVTTTKVFQKNPSLRNIEPRVGFAYDPFADHKTSIRAGFGIFYDLIEANYYMSGLWGAPPDYAITLQNPTTFPVPTSTFSTAALVTPGAISSTAPPLSNSGVDTWFAQRTPHMDQWNINIEHEFWDHTIVTLGYVGSVGIDLANGIPLNPSLPNAAGQYETFTSAGKLVTNPRSTDNLLLPSGIIAYGSLTEQAMIGHSNYHSMQFNINHPVRHDVQLNLAYTYSKCLDNGSADSRGFTLRSANPESPDPYNYAANYGRCGFDVTNTVRVNGVLRLPFNRNRLVSGWQLTPLFGYATGSPIDLSGISGWAGALSISRPNVISGCNLINGPNGAPAPGTFGVQWINTSCFQAQPVGTLGNFGRDVINTPNFVNFDLGFTKDTKLTERYSMEFRAEFFNLFNWTNLGAPNSAVLSLSANATCLSSLGTTTSAACGVAPASGGVITTPNQGGLSREIQFGLKVLF